MIFPSDLGLLAFWLWMGDPQMPDLTRDWMLMHWIPMIVAWKWSGHPGPEVEPFP